MPATRSLGFFIVVTMAACLTSPSSAQTSCGTHNEEYFLYNNRDYPSNQSTYWGDKDNLTNGIAHDATNWYITALGTDCIGRPNGDWVIRKIPVSENIVTYDPPDIPSTGFHKSFEPLLAPYGHAGDLDSFKHDGVYYLAVPLTGDGVTPVIAFFRADTLSFVNYSDLDPARQTDVGWCAVHPISGDLYTSRDDADSFLQYAIHWDRMFDRTRHDALEWVHSHPIEFTLHGKTVGATDPPNPLYNMQGGEFSPSGALLYINCGIITCFSKGVLYDQDGLHVFATAQEPWQHIEGSVTHIQVTDDGKVIREPEPGCFEYSFDNSGCSGEEPEGLTIWDMDEVPGHDEHVSGQLHVISYNHNIRVCVVDENQNEVFLKHYSTVKVEAMPDVTKECTGSTTAVEMSCQVSNTGLCGPESVLWSSPGVVFDDPTALETTGHFPPGASAGPAIVTVTATEGPSCSTDTVLVNIVDTTPPVVACPGDLTLECDSHCNPSLGGVPATDAAVTAWLASFARSDVCDPNAIVNLPYPACFTLGDTSVTFTVTDHSGNSSSCTRTVHVVDTTPPTIAVSLDRSVLWPPNHKLATINARVTVADVCDPNPYFQLIAIVSNEPDNGLGDGDTRSDVQGASYDTADTQFQLRSERSGTGAGRKYTITYRALDHSGNHADTAVVVQVPHD
jgi:hypothetical protein